MVLTLLTYTLTLLQQKTFVNIVTKEEMNTRHVQFLNPFQ